MNDIELADTEEFEGVEVEVVVDETLVLLRFSDEVTGDSATLRLTPRQIAILVTAVPRLRVSMPDDLQL